MFKVGEKVICIDNKDRDGDINIGEVYTISNIVSPKIGENGYLVRIKEYSDMLTFYSSRFRSIRKEKLERVLRCSK